MTGQTAPAPAPQPFSMPQQSFMGEIGLSRAETGKPRLEAQGREPTPEQVEAAVKQARKVIEQNLANFLGPEQKWVVGVVMKEVEVILGAGNFDATVAMQNLQFKLQSLDAEAKNLVAKCLQKLQDVMGSEQTSPRGPDLKNNTNQPLTALAA